MEQISEACQEQPPLSLLGDASPAQGTTVNTEAVVEEGVSVMCSDRKTELLLATYTL